MRKSVGTFCVVAVALLGLAGCGGGDASTASTTSTGSAAAGTSNPAQGSTSSTTTGSSNSLQPSLISGAPQTIVGVGQAYMFRPSVSAAIPVTFQIAGKPSWASFDSGTGTLSGTPSSADVGVNTGVQITASNSTMTSALPAFEITVTSSPATASTSGSTAASAAISSVTLSWTEPTTDTNGAPLTNLASYIVYFGTASQTYTNSIVVSNPNELSYVVDSLAVGQTYYFAVKAVTTSGTQSGFSPEVSTTI